MTERKVAGRYRLLEPIGEGGMGIVWRAHDELLDRVVAVKEVRYRGVDETARSDLNRRTIREARTAGRLDHPSVIIVHDVVEEEGRPWIVMQLVRSRSLGEVVRENGPLSPERVASIGLHVLSALRAAHAAGVLHRDVKPENVLLADDGRVVLTDFGIASMTQETSITRTGGVIGTPAFLPPERLHGLPATPESDLWSLGATLYAALEGHPPFERATAAATMLAVLHGDPSPMTHTGPLAIVILNLMARDPAVRMTSDQAEALLGRAYTGQPFHAEQPPYAGDSPYRGAPTHAGQSPYGSQPPYPDPGSWPHQERPTDAGGALARRAGVGRVALMAGVPALVALGVGGWLLLQGQGATTPNRPDPPTATAALPDKTTAEPSKPSRTPRPTPTPSSRPSQAIPEGWRLHRDPMGFTVAIPKGWTVKRFSGRDRVEFRTPGSNAFLWIESTEDPETDSVKHWKKVERGGLAENVWPGYKRIGITPLRYRGVVAADWEFTYVRNQVRTHVLDRGFRTLTGRPYAIYWESPDSEWDRAFFDRFTETFQP